MKKCPQCGREYDNSMMFCLDDGAELLYGPASMDATAILSEPPAVAGGLTPIEEQSSEFKTAILQPPATAGGSDPIVRTGSFNKRLLMVPLLLLLVATCGFFGYRYFASDPSKQIESIAVMPFVNESGNAEVEYLSDGMTETLISGLSKLPNLSVKARSTVFRFKGKETDTRTIGKELNVQAVLTGRVVQRGEQLTLGLELVDVATENVIWSQQYSRKESDLVALQSEVARDVSNRIQSKLSGSEEARVARSYTNDSEAYQLYLKGRFHWNKRTPDDLAKAVEHFKAAVEKDDQFALAYSGLADTYSVMQYYIGSRSADFIAQAKPYAVRSVELDDQLAEGHTSMAFVNEGLWNWAEAEKHYERAIALNPNYGPALLRYARFEYRMPKRDAQSLERMKRALEVEPSSLVINDNLSQTLLAQGLAEDALRQAKKTVELDPRYSFGMIDLAYAQIKTGDIQNALATADKVAEVAGRNSRSLACAGFVNAVSGRREVGTRILKELEDRYARNQADAVDVAAVYVGLGETDEAFAWLDKAFADHSTLLVDVRAEFAFAALLNDNRYKDLRRRMGLAN